MRTQVSAGAPRFDALEWINNYFQWNGRLKYDELKPVLGFCLLWALFEDKQCGKWADTESIGKCIDRMYKKSTPSKSDYMRYFEFFRCRYFQSKEPSKHSLDSFFRDGKEQSLRETVRRAFATPAPDSKTLVHALLLLTYRVRNNLFHGEKELYSLPCQTELFNELNSFLATFLEEARLNED